MSKVDELRSKYPSVAAATFNTLVEGDKSQTKKYLEFLLKSWAQRNDNFCPSTTNALINLVSEFDSLLPYIINKDIYSKDYADVSLVKTVVERARGVKEEKTFVRDEHGFVVDETDDYLFIQPKTHKGSLKWGANTRWCTASKNNPATFTNYTRSGVLIYLIDKKDSKPEKHRKLAFYYEYNDNPITSSISIFNTNDSYSQDITVISSWGIDVYFRLIQLFRVRAINELKVKKSKDYVEKVSNALKVLDISQLNKHMDILESSENNDYTLKLKTQIDEFTKTLNERKNEY